MLSYVSRVMGITICLAARTVALQLLLPTT